MSYSFSAEIIHDKEINKYIGFMPGLPGAHTQAESIDDLYVNLKEVIAFCLEAMTAEEICRLPQVYGRFRLTCYQISLALTNAPVLLLKPCKISAVDYFSMPGIVKQYDCRVRCYWSHRSPACQGVLKPSLPEHPLRSVIQQVKQIHPVKCETI